MIVMVTPVVLIMIILPERVMSLFGRGFDEAGILLAIMAVGQFINVATGSVGYLLNMSGHEKDFRRVTLFVGPLTIILVILFTHSYGVVGAAIGTAAGMLMQNLGAIYMVRLRLYFYPIG